MKIKKMGAWLLFFILLSGLAFAALDNQGTGSITLPDGNSVTLNEARDTGSRMDNNLRVLSGNLNDVSADMEIYKRAIVSVKRYGAVGDGVRDDLAALNRAVAATPNGSTLLLEANKSYYISSDLVIGKPMILDLNGSEIKLNPAAGWPHYQAIHITSAARSRIAWRQTLHAGETSLFVNRPDIPVGGTILLWLGTSPWGDSGTYEEGRAPHCYLMAKVLANNAGTLSIDIPLPYDVRGTTHYLYTTTSVVDKVAVKNGKITQKAVTGYGIFAEFSRNLSFENLEIDRSLCLGFVDNVRGNNLRFNGIARNDTVISGWFMRNVKLDNLLWRNAKSGAGSNLCISAEHNSDVHIGTMDAYIDEDATIVSVEGPGPGNLPSFVTFDVLKVRGSGRPFFAGGGNYNVDDLHLMVPNTLGCDFSKVQRPHLYNGINLGPPQRWVKNIPASALVSGGTGALPPGLYRAMWVRVNAAYTGQLYFHSNTTPDLAKDLMQIPLVNGSWVAVPCVQSTGSGNGIGDVNAIYHTTKELLGYLSSSAGSIDVMIDYFPDLSKPFN